MAYRQRWILVCAVVAGHGAYGQDLDQLAARVAEYAAVWDSTSVSDASEHYARLMPLLPKSLRAASPHAQIGSDAIQAWWRQQDPLPASPANERMIEHVRRVDYALGHFACGSCLSGYDARGEVYVRFGPPERETVVQFDDPLLIDAIYRPGVAVSPGDFPENVFWRYGHIDRDAYFLFVNSKDGYQYGETADLLPRSLKVGFDQGGRGSVKAEMALAAMRAIYRQLALEHAHFGPRFNDVDLWLSAQEQTGRMVTRNLTDAVNSITGAEFLRQGERPDGPDFAERWLQPAATFAQGMIANARMEDTQIAHQQRTRLPAAFSNVERAIPRLPVAVRHARFLEPDGRTRIEVYWSAEAPADGLIQVFAQSLGSAYDGARDTTFALRVASEGETAAIPAQVLMLREDRDEFHLALQLDQYTTYANGARARERVATYRIDSLSALDRGGQSLGVSDLRLISTDLHGNPRPHPFEHVSEADNIGVYFEIYNLMFGPGDRTGYTLEYEVASLDGRTRSSAATAYEGQGRNAWEEIFIDLGDWSGALTITVHVRDDIARTRAKRSIRVVR